MRGGEEGGEGRGGAKGGRREGERERRWGGLVAVPMGGG